jgi:uncharacterized protein (TIGR03437 family)
MTLSPNLVRLRVPAVVLLLAIAGCLFPLVHQSAQEPRYDASDLSRVKNHRGQFVIRKTDNGASCQIAKPDETIKSLDRPRSGLHTLSGVRLRDSATPGLQITLRGTDQLNNFPQAKQAFLNAAARWQSIIQNQITVVIDVDFGPTIFGDPFGPNVLGSTDPQMLVSGNLYSGRGGIRSQLVNGASSPRETTLYGSLPATLPTDLGAAPGGLVASANLRGLGIINAVANPDSETANFGPPPSIGFNSAFTYDFEPTDGIDADKIDFDSVAFHEMGHVLGFGSHVGDRELDPTDGNFPTVLDIFRFKPGITLPNFMTANRLQLSGGDQIFFAGGNEIALSTGRPDGTGGDGEQASHWKADEDTGQYLGIMDPTISSGRREGETANDLLAFDTLGYRLNSGLTVTEELSVDDAVFDAAIQPTNQTIVVNRLTPSTYPAKLSNLRVRIPVLSGQPSPVGSQIRLVVFTDPASTGQPSNSPQFIYDQTMALPTLPSGRFFELHLADGPTINSGDFYFGFQAPNGGILIATDSSGPQNNRSFISTDNGTSFQLLKNSGGASVNFMARVVVSSPYDNNPSPRPAVLSPNSTAPGGTDFQLFVLGRNFVTGATVRWNGVDRPTILNSGSQLQATITAADIATAGTANVTVSNPAPGVSVSSGLTFNISPGNPAPTLTRLDPNIGAAGGPNVSISVFGTSFVSSSVAQWNGMALPTNVVSSIQLTAQVPAANLAMATGGSPAIVTVATPGPGGGTSNTLPFSVVTCGFSLSNTSQPITSDGGNLGVVVSSNGPCPWSAVASDSWISLTSPTTGTGTSIVTYSIASNPSKTARTGQVTIGGQKVTIMQAGLLAAVSSASFIGPLAPDELGSLFGDGMADTNLFAGLPLPNLLGNTFVILEDKNSNDFLVPLLFASPGQINMLVPSGTVSGLAEFSVFRGAAIVSSGSVMIQPVAPGLFSANTNGKGVAAAYALRVKPGGTQINEQISIFDPNQQTFVSTPIDLTPSTDQVFLVLYGTGIRHVTSQNGVTVSVGGTILSPSFVGVAPGFEGLDQINVLLPGSVAGKGEVDVILTADSKVSNTVRVNIK